MIPLKLRNPLFIFRLGLVLGGKKLKMQKEKGWELTIYK